MSELGLITLRFSNHQILTEIDAVIEQIYYVVRQRLESPLLRNVVSHLFQRGTLPRIECRYWIHDTPSFLKEGWGGLGRVLSKSKFNNLIIQNV